MMGIGWMDARRGLSRWLALGLTLWLVAMLLLPAARVSAQSGSDPSAATPGVINIGVGTMLVPGDPSSDWGWGERNAVKLALDQTNAAGGVRIGGVRYDLQLAEANDGCSEGGGLNAANYLVGQGVVAVVGHGCTAATVGADEVYSTAGVPMITPSASGPFLTTLGYDTTFRLITRDGVPGSLTATYLRKRLGSSRAAVMWGPLAGPNSDFVKTYESLGGQVVVRAAMGDSSVFQDMLDRNVDAVYFSGVWGNPAEYAGELLQQLRAAGVTATFAWDTMDNNLAALDTFVQAAGSVDPQRTIASLSFRPFDEMPGWSTFLAQYQAANFEFAKDDPGVAGVYAYDAARMVIAAIRSAQSTNPGAIRDALAATRNFKGVMGTYSYFDANGEVVPQWAWLERYNNGHWQVVK